MNEEQIIKYMLNKKYIKGKYICWDFVMDIYKDLYNINLPEYPVVEVQAEFKNKLVSNLNAVKVEQSLSKEGDIVVFSRFANQHAGVMLNKKEFIHLCKEGVRVMDLKNLCGIYNIYRILNNV